MKNCSFSCTKKTARIFCFFILLTACTKTITPALNNAAPQLIIQGVISDTAGPYYVSVVNSVGFYADNTYPGISGAAVTITDNSSGITDVLTETSAAGVYMTHSLLQGIYGHVYSLNVTLSGKSYTASSTMPQPVALDSTSFDVSDTKQIRAQANFQDPAGVANFYKYSTVINGVVDKRFQTFKDRLSDGRYIRDKMDNDTSEIKLNDVVQLSLVGVDKGVYDYLSQAETIAYSNDNLAAPASPVSNISGGCLGYFSAQTVSSKTAVVK